MITLASRAAIDEALDTALQRVQTRASDATAANVACAVSLVSLVSFIAISRLLARLIFALHIP